MTTTHKHGYHKTIQNTIIGYILTLLFVPTSFAQWDLINSTHSSQTIPSFPNRELPIDTPDIINPIGNLIAYNRFFKFTSLAPMLQKQSFIVEFLEGRNEFKGALIITVGTPIPPKSITFESSHNGGTTTLVCKRQLHGYYYNPARGQFIRPLSSRDRVNNVTSTGGIYTECKTTSPANPTQDNTFDVIGKIDYHYNGGKRGSLYWGINTTIESNGARTTLYQPGVIQWLKGTTLQGKFLDTMYGVGTIRGNSHNPDLIGALTNILVQGQAGLGTSTEETNRKVLSVSLAGTKTLLNNTAEANSSKILNLVNKKASQLCPKYEKNPNMSRSTTICKEGDLEINTSNAQYLEGKDIIVNNGNITIDVGVFKSISKPFSLYITKGNLLLRAKNNWSLPSTIMGNFDANGFVSSSGTNQGLFLKGNFIVNGLILEKDLQSIPLKTYLHGKLVSLNTFDSTSAQREQYLQYHITKYQAIKSTTHTKMKNFYPDGRNPSLTTLFAWRCDPQTGKTAQIPGWEDIHDTLSETNMNCLSADQNYALTIIDTAIPTQLF